MNNSTLKSQRPHIAFFGCTNVGKSSLVNAITNQNISIVSDVKGTTTDAVSKSMEILPLGAVVIIDTAGLDDTSELGNLRIEKTKQILDKTDIAILVIDATSGENNFDKELIDTFKKKNIPYLIVHNKADLIKTQEAETIYTSTLTGFGINELKEKIGNILKDKKEEKFIIRDRINAKDVIILVTPIDESAPKGRLILPQQLVLREILDAHATAICTQPEELENLLKTITPKFIITDSQVFNKVKTIVPQEIVLTSFSILMANFKGELQTLLNGAEKLSNLKDGDKILISEGCTHHRQCNDIGTVKIPKWITDFSGKNLDFQFTQGGEFPQDLNKFALIVHCGGCMLNEAEMKSRLAKANEQNIPIINYGMAIAHMNGILERSMEIFK